MVNTADPVTQWAFIILVSVVMGTCVLIAIAFFRRWQQIRYVRYVHILQRKYRPVLAEALSGVWSPAGTAALQELPLADLEILLEPLFSKRRITEQSLFFLRSLCAELGLIEVWQNRLANGQSARSQMSGSKGNEDFLDRGKMPYLLRAKSLRNLGRLQHRPSWPLMVSILNDPQTDLQLVALRSLAALGAPESFPALRERLHAVAQGKSPSPPLQRLTTAMLNFDLNCVQALLPSLRHPDRQIRMHATEILLRMVRREAARHPGFTLTRELLTPSVVELLLAELPVDPSAEIRARAAEVIVFLHDPRTIPVLRDLLRDHQWFVRLRSSRALAHLHHAAAPLHLDIRECLCDPHWRVREAAIQTLISLGPEGRHQLYDHFLTSLDMSSRQQVVEVIERTGLISTLLERYSAGAKGEEARMVEQLATTAAPLGLSGVLHTLSPEVRQQFLNRFFLFVQSKKATRPEEARPAVEKADKLQQVIDSPPFLAA